MTATVNKMIPIRPPVMAPRSLIGSVAPVMITDVGTNTLFGALAEQPIASELAAAGA